MVYRHLHRHRGGVLGKDGDLEPGLMLPLEGGLRPERPRGEKPEAGADEEPPTREPHTIPFYLRDARAATDHRLRRARLRAAEPLLAS
jgi:hypothetical protein